MSGGGQRGALLLVAACHQVFTLSDGALRMLVLLHLHAQGHTAWALALVLLPYEIAGVFSNLLGGWCGARFGLKATLLAGVLLQAVACALLAVDAAALTVPYVMTTQVLSGIAKDLAKTAAKSFVARLPAPRGIDPERSTFRRVTALTGGKNAMKGVGFFAGGALLTWVGFAGTNAALAALLLVVAAAAARSLPTGATTRVPTWRTVLVQGRALRWLALARAFLFGSRDLWFAVALPVFLVGTLHWSAAGAGAFLAAWVIGYGAVQALTPAIARPRSRRHGASLAAIATGALLVPLGVAVGGVWGGAPTTITVTATICGYGAVFAIASGLHSWLVVALAGTEHTAERVGFYYAANSVGRVAGTLGSGIVFERAGDGTNGFVACLLAAAASVLLAAACTLMLRRTM